jgi:hypothetical protein
VWLRLRYVVDGLFGRGIHGHHEVAAIRTRGTSPDLLGIADGWSTGRRRAVAICAFALGAGCSGPGSTAGALALDGAAADAATPDVTTDDPVAGACDTLFDAAKTAGPFGLVPRAERGDDLLFPPFACSEEPIPTVVEPILRAQFVRNCEEILDAPDCSLTGGWLDGCVAAMSHVACGGPRPDACAPPTGIAPENAGGLGDYQCASGWCDFCSCGTPIPIGGGCSINEYDPLSVDRCANNGTCEGNPNDPPMGYNGGGGGTCVAGSSGVAAGGERNDEVGPHCATPLPCEDLICGGPVPVIDAGAPDAGPLSGAPVGVSCAYPCSPARWGRLLLDSLCQSGLHCNAGVCAAPLPLGSACSGQFSTECGAPPFECNGYGVCVETMNGRSAWHGEPCRSNGIEIPCMWYDLIGDCPSNGVCPPLADVESDCASDGAANAATCGPYASCVSGIYVLGPCQSVSRETSRSERSTLASARSSAIAAR